MDEDRGDSGVGDVEGQRVGLHEYALPAARAPATYRQAIPIADERYTEHLISLKEDES